ncbi:MAG: hypothetical protein H8E30_00680 [Alphaproteobacteria bacterium]|nr:hypothetical protein [Alphaproteobacteria bacterium]
MARQGLLIQLILVPTETHPRTMYMWNSMYRQIESCRTPKELEEYQDQAAMMPRCQAEIQKISKCHALEILRRSEEKSIMNQAIENWLNSARHDLELLGIRVTHSENYQPGSFHVDLENNQFLGGVCFWPPNVYEFQFHRLSSGEIIVLETKNFDDARQLKVYLDHLVFDTLSKI